MYSGLPFVPSLTLLLFYFLQQVVQSLNDVKTIIKIKFDLDCFRDMQT
jgi:hypothetical protein